LVVAVLLFLPEGQVFLEEFDNALGISKIVFLELVNLVKSILESLIGQVAGSLVVFHNFVVENGEVEGEAELDGVAGRKSNLVSLIVGLEGVLLDRLHKGTLCVLCDVAVVVTDHLDEEGLGLTVARLSEHLVVDGVNNVLAVLVELTFNGGFVASECISIFGVLGILLDGGNSAACGSLGTDKVLESDGEEVTLIGGDLSTLSVEDLSEEVNHVFEALGLLSDTGEENVLFNVCHLNVLNNLINYNHS
jgi:hypothetical protein